MYTDLHMPTSYIHKDAQTTCIFTDTRARRHLHPRSSCRVPLGLYVSFQLSMSFCFNTGLFDDVLHLGGQMRVGTYFETVLRLFRFKNQTAGEAYLRSHPPVFYLRASHGHDLPLPPPRYKSRAHPGNRHENPPPAALPALSTPFQISFGF